MRSACVSSRIADVVEWEHAMDKASRIYVAGHRGLVGSAIVRRLQKEGYANIVARTHAELELTDAAAGAQLGLSVRTVQRRVAELMERAGVTTRIQLGAEAVRRGWA